jgi:hypothetical protein
VAQHDSIDVVGVLCSAEGLPQFRDQYGQQLSGNNEPQRAPDVPQGGALDDFAGGGEEVAQRQRTWRTVLGGVDLLEVAYREVEVGVVYGIFTKGEPAASVSLDAKSGAVFWSEK